MPNQDWWIVFKTKKEGNAPKELSNDLKEVKKGLTGAIEGFTGMSISGLGVAGVIAGVGAAMKQSIDATVELADQVRDLGRTSGTSAEDTSRLIQTADDLFISFDTLKVAAKTLAQNGIALTTDSLADLADKYKTIPDPADKAKFALDNFGKSGLEMTKALELGGDAIRQMAAEQSGALIMTQDQVDAAEKLKQAQDALNDTAAALSVTFGNVLIPVLTGALNWLDQLFNGTARANRAFEQQKDTIVENSATWEEYVAKIVQARAQEQGEVKSLEEVRKGIEANDRGYSFAANNIGFMSQATFEQIKAQAALTREMDLTAENMGGDQAAYEAFQKRMGEDLVAATIKEKDALDLLNASMGDLTAKVLYNTASEGLNAAGKMALALKMGLINQNTYDAVGAQQALKTAYENGQMSLDVYTQRSADLVKNLGLIQSKDVTVTVNYKSTGSPGSYQIPSNPKLKSSYAAGGSFVVPAGYPNDTYPLGPHAMASSGEVVTVTPKGKGGGALPAMNVYINNSMDLESFKRMLMQVMR